MTPEAPPLEHTTHGKWSLPDVPHRGWTCEYVEDLGAPAALCQMCEHMEIRYVHYMTHPDYPDELGCGCVCAGNMEEDYAAASGREQRLKAKARRRKTWGDREWQTSRKGNPTLRTEGYDITVFPQGDGWGFCVAHAQQRLFSRRRYLTAEAAMMGSLDGLLWAKEHLLDAKEARYQARWKAMTDPGPTQKETFVMPGAPPSHRAPPQVAPDKAPSLMIYCDGLVEPTNPGGYGCWGVVVYDARQTEVHTACGSLGREPTMTNNIAEYAAVVEALRWVADQQILGVALYTDSQLVVQQVSGAWACNKPHLQAWRDQVRAALQQCQGTLTWVPREQNTRADQLSREGYQQARRGGGGMPPSSPPDTTQPAVVNRATTDAEVPV